MITKEALKNIKSIKKNLSSWAIEAILENKTQIILRLRNFQLSKGLNSNGTVVGTYSPATEGYADRDNISTPKTPGSPYNFYWTGDTLEGLYIKDTNKRANTYDISTSDGKKRLLEEAYGEIFDLTEENNDWVNENIIEPYLAKKIEENLFVF